MNDETKRDVFDAVWNRLAGYQVFFNGWPRETLDGYKKRYDNALPDNLPVIPKAVGEYLKTHRKDLLGEIFWKLGCKSSAFLDSNELYIVLNSDTFASAWVLGVWRVEETGEIVKLEEDK